MKIEEIKAEPRTTQGSSRSRRLRAGGKVPGILYGHGQEVVMLSLPGDALRHVLESGRRLVTLRLGDKQEGALVKEVQYDTWGQEILHVDFGRVSLDEIVTVEVEVVSHGTPKGQLSGGVLEQPLRRVKVACKANEIPDQIRVEVERLDLNDKVSVKDLPVPPGVKITEDPDAIVFIVKETREEEVVVAAPAAEAGAAEPELIKRAVKEGEEAEEEGQPPAKVKDGKEKQKS